MPAKPMTGGSGKKPAKKRATMPLPQKRKAAPVRRKKRGY